MKILVTASGETPESPVDPRFGRAAKFIVHDSETGEFLAVDNSQNLNAAQGAGIQAAQTVVDLGADVVLTGHCGPNAFRTLSVAGVQVVVGVEGTVAEAVERFKAGDIQPAEAPDVQGHWT